jgi:hypothetical protein
MTNVAEVDGIVRFPGTSLGDDQAACAGEPTSAFFPSTPGAALDHALRIYARAAPCRPSATPTQPHTASGTVWDIA